MDVLFILIFCFLGSVITKFSFISILVSTKDIDKKLEFKLRNDKFFYLRFLITPFVSFNKTLKSVVKQYRQLRISEIFGFLIFGLSAFGVIRLIDNSSKFEILTLGFVLIYLITVAALLYLTVYDILYFAIPTVFTTRLLLLTIGFQLLFALIRVIDIQLFVGLNISAGQISNLIGFLIMYFFIWGLILFTGEKAMGKGDAEIAGIIGLVLGLELVLNYLLFTFIIGGLLALAYSFYLGKVKNVLIPMVPILLIGYTITIIVNDSSLFLNFDLFEFLLNGTK